MLWHGHLKQNRLLTQRVENRSIRLRAACKVVLLVGCLKPQIILATHTYLSGNNPGIHRDASAAGKTRRSGARGPSEASTPRSTRAETIRRAWRSPAPTTPAASPRDSSPR